MKRSIRFLAIPFFLVLIWACAGAGNPLRGVDIPEPENPDPIYYFFRGTKTLFTRQNDKLPQARADFELVIKNDPTIMYPEAYPFLVECYKRLEIADSSKWIYEKARQHMESDETLKTKLSTRFEAWQKSYPVLPEEFKKRDYKLLESNVEPVGGYQVLYRNLEYPEMARSMNRSGTSYFSFMVEADGSISDLTLLVSSYPDLDEAAMAAINKTVWVSAKYDGRPVPFQMILPIMFRL